MTVLDADWLRAPETQSVLGMLEQAGHHAYVVGGCVRNAFLDAPVHDIDIATDAPPEIVGTLAENQGFKAVPTGLAFGTMTVVVHDQPFEVTTFRRDVETDGRRAVVAYSDDIAEDAARRDFTMNALYANASGDVIDPVGGLDDLLARKLRFVGVARERIKEDYLRSLRYFRFFAWYADDSGGFDAEAISAIAELAEGLDRLSKERIGHEMRKLLAAPDPVFSVAGMAKTGVLSRLLPGSDPRFLGPLVHFEQEAKLAPRWQRRLVVLGGEGSDEALRLSKSEAREIAAVLTCLENGIGPGEAAYRFGTEIARDSVLVSAAMSGAPPAPFAHLIQEGAAARFPVSARDLPEALDGPEIGVTLKSLEKRWIASGFKLSRDELLS